MPKSATRKKAAKQTPPKKTAQKKMSFFQRLMLNRMLTKTSSKYVRTPRQKSGTPTRYNVASGGAVKFTVNPQPLKKSEAKALRNMLNASPGGGPYRVCVAR